MVIRVYGIPLYLQQITFELLVVAHAALAMLQPRALQFLNHADPFDPSTLAYHLFSCWIGRRSKIGVAVSTNSETFLYLIGNIGYFDLITPEAWPLCVWGTTITPSHLASRNADCWLISTNSTWMFGESCLAGAEYSCGVVTYDFFPTECVSKLPSSPSLQSRDESIMLFFPPIVMLLRNSQEMYELCWRKCPLCLYATAKKFTIGDGEWLVWVLFYTLLEFDSLQFSVDCPTVPALPAWRVSRDLTLSHEVRRPRQACWIMKRLECRVLGRAPGNPLAHFWSCRQYYY